MTAKKNPKGYEVRINKYKRDPFRPMPHNRQSAKSRRNHPVMGGIYCGKRYTRDAVSDKIIKRCTASPRKCDVCYSFNEFTEKE